MSGTQVLSGAAAGAAAGSVVPGWGTAIGAVAGGLMGALSGDGGAGAQRQMSRDALQNAMNQQQYAKILNQLALERSVAGSVDAQGNQIRYDPGTNTWVSTLGARPAAIQAAEDQSTLTRNAVDIPQASANNIAQSVLASKNRSGLSGAINNYNSYVPITAAAEGGALQDASTRANQTSQAPIIADTLRQFTRSGTAAGPVLAQLERANTDSLATEMDNNVIRSQTGAADVNTANRTSLAQPVQTLSAAGQPSMSFAPLTGNNPAAGIAAQVNGRAVGSAGPGTQGAYSTAFGTSASNQASQMGVNTAMNSPLPGELASLNQSIKSLGKDGAFGSLGTSINDWWNNSGKGQVGNYGGGLYGPPDPRAPSTGTDVNAMMGITNGGSPIGIPNDPSAYNPGSMWTY